MLGILMGIGMLIVPLIFAPRKPNPVKYETFESGQLPTGEARVRLVMRYYPYLLMFLIFDVMSLFLYAWSQSYRQYAFAANIPVLIFIAVLAVALKRALSLAGRREIW
jgi:NADH-quinone oxidoreductase subunit A